jgi:hypothetical protein
VSNEPIETDQHQDSAQVPIRIIRTDGRHAGRLCSTFVYCLAPAELEPEVLGTLLDAVTDEDIAACLEVSADELGLRVVYGRPSDEAPGPGPKTVRGRFMEPTV